MCSHKLPECYARITTGECTCYGSKLNQQRNVSNTAVSDIAEAAKSKPDQEPASLKPPRLWLSLVASNDGERTHIRKWSHAPFDGGVEYRLGSETAAIVAWLRSEGSRRMAQYPFRIAEEIERGDHLKFANAIADQVPEGGDACGSIHASGGGKANRQNPKGAS